MNSTTTIQQPRGPVMADVEGLTLTAEEYERLQHPAVGSVILFTRNYQTPEQLERLTGEIHALREPRLLIGVDHEGGRVQRFRDGFTPLPAVRKLGELYDRDAEEAVLAATTAGWLMAAELLELGVDFSFAPVADLDAGVSAVIGDRAYHGDPLAAARLAGGYMRGMRNAGMAATAKHFPGHGGVAGDSHLVIPVDERPYEAIEARDLVPFRELIREGVAGIMTAHVIYRQVDDLPPTFSRFWLGEILRERLGFDGVVFSDDLSMAGAQVAGGPLERAVAALEAGCDVVLLCNDTRALDQVLDGLAGRPLAGDRLAAFAPRIHLAGPVRGSAPWRAAVDRLGALA